MTAQSLDFASRDLSSFSTASRMNSARLFFPTTASMRSGMSSGKRTIIGFTFSGGRPMRTGLCDIGKIVNFFSICAIKRYLLLTSGVISDIGYVRNRKLMEMKMTTEAKKEKILAAIAARGWFTAEIYWNEACALRDAGLIKVCDRFFVGGNRKIVWVAA